MRAAIALAALAVGTLAIPHKNKRDLEIVYETVTDFVYVYNIVTVTAADGAVSSTTIIATTTSTSVITETSTPAVATSSSEQMFSILPFPVSETELTPPPDPTVVSSPYSTSYAPTTTAVPQPVAAPPPADTPVTSKTGQQTPAAIASGSANRQVTGYNNLALAHHNIHRQNHSAPNMVWDTDLANTAQRIAETCVYAHNVQMDRDSIGGYGQNIAAGVDAANVSLIITDLFYNGEVNWYDNFYGEAQPDMTDFEHWGHFSQIVWHDTTKVGCATVHCTNGLSNVANNVPPFFTVCNYQGPGNIAGQYNKVGSPLGYPTVHWDYFN